MTQYAIAALKEKRAEIAGRLEALSRELADARQSLAAVDTTLRLFGYEAPETIRARREQRTIFGPNLKRAILEELRARPEGVLTTELATVMMAAHDVGEENARYAAKAVSRTLHKLAARGLVQPGELRNGVRVWRPSNG